MSAFIVTYDLIQQGQNYQCIIGKLKEMGAYHLQQSVWIVSSTSSAIAIRDALAPCLDRNDKLFVGRLDSAAWNGYSDDVTAWLKTIIV